MSRTGSWSRKLAARTSSTSLHSAGEALSTDTARGRLLSAAIAMILVPLPRRVGPMAKPPFWRLRRLHRQTPHPDQACLARADAGPASVAPRPICHRAPRPGTGDGRSGREDTSRASQPTAHRCPKPIAHRSALPVCHATDGLGYPCAAEDARPAPTTPTVRLSVPNDRPLLSAETP